MGDLMVTRFSQSSVSVLNHLHDYSGHGDKDSGGIAGADGRRREPEGASSSSSSVTTTKTTTTSMRYLHQTVVLCELRHDAFEGCMPSGPSVGMVSKWRPKDRMKTGCVALVLCLNISVDPPDVIKISPCARMECWIDGIASWDNNSDQLGFQRWPLLLDYNNKSLSWK